MQRMRETQGLVSARSPTCTLPTSQMMLPAQKWQAEMETLKAGAHDGHDSIMILPDSITAHAAKFPKSSLSISSHSKQF
eukprot:1145240-Pelagomonas_calceolata.AAC.3